MIDQFYQKNGFAAFLENPELFLALIKWSTKLLGLQFGFSSRKQLKHDVILQPIINFQYLSLMTRLI